MSAVGFVFSLFSIFASGAQADEASSLADELFMLIPGYVSYGMYEYENEFNPNGCEVFIFSKKEFENSQGWHREESEGGINFGEINYITFLDTKSGGARVTYSFESEVIGYSYERDGNMEYIDRKEKKNRISIHFGGDGRSAKKALLLSKKLKKKCDGQI
ncbi:hypothetical protein [Marinobacter salinus]|nr:hypothetical protein [Marinobacter salinus]